MRLEIERLKYVNLEEYMNIKFWDVRAGHTYGQDSYSILL